MTSIPDAFFLSPEEVNLQPCLTASRFLNTVPESVSITQCCQDTNNTSLVIINFVLVGAFLFTPTLRILAVDDDTSYEQNNVQGIFALGHVSNPEIPINTNCTTYHGTLVFDIGSAITNYITAQRITFELVMQGTVPLSYGVSFPNQTVSDTFEWNKGVLPQPVNLTYTNGNLGVTFEYNGQTNCSCNIQCFIPSGVSQQITFCPGEKQTVFLYRDPLSIDPYSILIQLSDSLGNVSEINTQTMLGMIPKAPLTLVGTKPKRVQINLTRLSANDVQISDDAKYQILKYQGSEANAVVWKDWSSIAWSHFVDYEVVPYETYGYAVRFMGPFGDVSNQSSWTVVTI